MFGKLSCPLETKAKFLDTINWNMHKMHSIKKVQNNNARQIPQEIKKKN